jgi:hypothetical protein
MLKALNDKHSRFTRREIQEIRRRGAQNGYAIQESDLTSEKSRLTALMKALPTELLSDMREWLTTGQSKLTQASCPPELRQRFSEALLEDHPNQ